MKIWNSSADYVSPPRKQSEDKYRRGRGLLCDNSPAIDTTWRKVANKITQKLMGGLQSRIFSSFSWGTFGHATCLDQSQASANIRWILRRHFKESIKYFCSCAIDLNVSSDRIFPNFKSARAAKNIRRIMNTIASIWLWKHARVFVHGQYLFRKANSFPRA